MVLFGRKPEYDRQQYTDIQGVKNSIGTPHLIRCRTIKCDKIKCRSLLKSYPSSSISLAQIHYHLIQNLERNDLNLTLVNFHKNCIKNIIHYSYISWIVNLSWWWIFILENALSRRKFVLGQIKLGHLRAALTEFSARA